MTSLPTITNGPAVSHDATSMYQYGQGLLFQPRPIEVIVIGAGLSGIAGVKLFKEKFGDSPIKFRIYEKNHDVCGTWLENRYPGCACDVPAHGYTYPWEGNPYWSRGYVGSEEIFDYFKGRAETYGVFDYVKLSHKVIGAVWNQQMGKWKVEIEDLQTRQTFFDEAEFFINAGGFLNKWRYPDIAGIGQFKGHLAHSASWDQTYDYNGKTVAVIGSGSSAIQIVPSLQPIVKKLISINRSATWITPEMGAGGGPEGRETTYTKEQQKHWAENPEEFLRMRKGIENSMNHLFEIHYVDSDAQKNMAGIFGQQMRERLSAKPEVADQLIPKFNVGCRRITPGTGYLEALASKNVDVHFGGVSRITQSGLEMEDGTMLEVDAIVCATGFDTSFKPAFPLIGPNGHDLRDVWKDEPPSYLSVGAAGFPNYFMIGGPNFTFANGVFLISVETAWNYIFQVIEKVQTEGIISLSPKQRAVDDFQAHKDSLMNDMVWTGPCASWYKLGKRDGKVFGPWPGSSIHFIEAMSRPRWEDYDYEYIKDNRFNYFGRGMTIRESKHGDLAYYLRERGLCYDEAPKQESGLF
ncbi:hypothetical protein H2204_000410 [Knufia peltigerae]|uniref:Uncharacterized protein n=1 Tax=Knufia peltigerae TaxID=1002370 RepID=A0AA38YEL2_9EURO|nr:hypothetical protein H2204_000410 [Knufia peltigerae]